MRARDIAVIAFRSFGSASITELAEIVILCLIGMIASILLAIPGDQTGDGLRWLITTLSF